MLKSAKDSEDMQLVFKEFVRQKYDKYRFKYPLLKEAEIYRKTKQEWESLDKSEKLALLDNFQKKKVEPYVMMDEMQAQGVLQAKIEKKQKVQEDHRTKGQPKSEPSRRVNPETVTEIQLHEAEKTPQRRDKIKQTGQTPVSSSEDNVLLRRVRDSSPSDSSSKNKDKKKGIRSIRSAINNLPNSEYIRFFQFYYQRLTKEHPTWTGRQRTIIIKLLWKKRKTMSRRQKTKINIKKSSFKNFENRKVTPYEMYLKHRVEMHPEMKVKQIRKTSLAIWKKLHRSGRRYFRRQAELHNRKFMQSANKSEQSTNASNLRSLLNKPISAAARKQTNQ